jgi:excisionase family DNA binding protein
MTQIPALVRPTPTVGRRVTPTLFWSVRRAAKHLGVSELTARRYIRDGRLTAVQIGGTWRIPAADHATARELPDQCSIRQIANSLGVSEVSVRRWIRSGAIQAAKFGGAWKIPRHVVEELLDARTGAQAIEAETLSQGGRTSNTM